MPENSTNTNLSRPLLRGNILPQGVLTPPEPGAAGCSEPSDTGPAQQAEGPGGLALRDLPEYLSQILLEDATSILEDALSRARLDAEREASIDTLAPAPPLENPNQQCLDLAQRTHERGGKTKRPPPPVEWMLGPVKGRQSARRPSFATPFVDIAAASDEQVADMMHHIYVHRGRRMGMSKRDYAWQAELTQARSLTYGFYDSQRSLERPSTITDTFAAAILGDEETPARRRLIAMVATADRMEKFGITMAGPEFGGLMRVATSTAWGVIAWAEKRGIIFRMHRWKPSKSKKGSPVKHAANWYGIGPEMLRHRDLYLGQAELDLQGEEITPGLAAEALGAVRIDRRRHRARHRRTRRAIGVRARARARARGKMVSAETPAPNAGTAMPSMHEFAELVVEGEMVRDEVRAKVRRSDEAREGELSRQAKAMVEGTASVPDFDALDFANAAERAEAVEAVQDIGGLEALEPSDEAESALVWLAADGLADQPGHPNHGQALAMVASSTLIQGPDGHPMEVHVDCAAEVETAVSTEREKGVDDGLSASDVALACGGSEEPSEESRAPRDTIRLPDGTVPVKLTGINWKGSRSSRNSTDPPQPEAPSKANSPPVSSSQRVATPPPGAVASLDPPPLDQAPKHARASRGPPSPDPSLPGAAGRIPKGKRVERPPPRKLGGISLAASSAVQSDLASMKNRDLADIIARALCPKAP